MHFATSLRLIYTQIPMILHILQEEKNDCEKDYEDYAFSIPIFFFR